MGSAPTPALPRGSSIADLLARAAADGASDLHLADGVPPLARIDGSLVALCDECLSSDMVESLCREMLVSTGLGIEQLEGAIDFALVIGARRVRANIFRRRQRAAACLRLINDRVPPLAELGLPAAVMSLIELRHGLVLVTGPTGAGKSTTLAALVQALLQSRAAHVLTIEDPIEFVHGHGRGLITQRELGADTPTYAQALRHALRQDPDAILIGELRDAETVRAALTLAETGHLTLSTLHSPTAVQAVRRVIDLFPVAEQGAVRAQLAEVLQAVVAQSLVSDAAGRGRALAAEFMVANPAIRALIRDDKTHQIQSQIEAGQSESGMQTMTQAIAALRRADRTRGNGGPPGAFRREAQRGGAA